MLTLIIEAASFFTCAKCNYRSCYSCRTPVHLDETCAQHQAKLHSQQSPEERRAQKYIMKKAKRCPNENCRIATQKVSGCDHMTCSQCDEQWCWRCQVSYTAIDAVGNSAHKTHCPHYRADPATRHRVRGQSRPGEVCIVS